MCSDSDVIVSFTLHIIPTSPLVKSCALLYAVFALYSKSLLLWTTLLWTAAYYGQQQNPRSVTFFNSVIKTPLLRTLLMDSRLLRTLFWSRLKKSPLLWTKSTYFREKHNFLTNLSNCSAMMCEANCRKTQKN